jgi:peptidoglycan/xylan/chitin deacetylase (PgdA/CDA1 family)
MVRALLAAALAVSPGAAQGARHKAPVPILMYHVISAPRAHVPYPNLYVRPADFTGQMNWLARRGYHAVTLKRVYDYWTRGAKLPLKPIVVTFDDGYLSDYVNGFRTLERHGWPGVLNLEVRHTQAAGGMLPWRIRKLIAAGWEIDAHTITHPDLTTVDDARLRYEVAGSRKEIRRRFHVPVDFFCYPSGRYDTRVISEVKRAGYFGATTTNEGFARPPSFFTLSRVRVNGSDGIAGFAAKLGS